MCPQTRPRVRFWEYNSHDAEGKPLDMSKRLSVGKRLKLPEDKETTASYSDPTFVLGGDWNPLLCRYSPRSHDQFGWRSM